MEIVFRSLFVFGFLWFITRVTGRSTLGELSTFQLVLYVTMGDLVQQAVTQQDYSVTAAVLAVGVFSLLTIALSWVNSRWGRVRPITHGIPVVVVENGVPIDRIMRAEKVSMNDLMTAAREQGVQSFDDVEIAVLETNGKISFFTAGSGESGAPEPPDTG
jgi:uncharacterized membrane protein YcaP (DUF421 family)